MAKTLKELYMAKTLSKKEIERLGFISTGVGLTDIAVRKSGPKRILRITHSGNMGNTIERSVDPNIEKIGFPKIKQLKKMFDVINEEGDPDYYYSIEFDITNKDSAKALKAESEDDKMKKVQKKDMKMNESVLRKVIREEIRKIIKEAKKFKVP